ncbi:hypothetical protein HPP92_010810 [Vanilla planifolia]|uniref:DUF547 domain-containing protein n=1 Tax=Vanilla planifolia TaxID=51239 RepID=A0A835R5X7_VANPL|nr:hypothetical protein HPP92_010810 [Vanilla planifolia]
MAEGKSSSKNPLIFQLEQDVQNLQRLLEEEIKLHAILENAVDDVAVKISDASCLRNDAQELFCNISSLETSVGKLEEEIISLKFQLIQERNERRLFEYQLKQLSGSTRSMHQNDQVNMDNALIEEEEYLKMIHKFGKLKPMPHRLSNQPNLLSEEIVRCMKNIFISLADSSTLPSNLYSSDSFHSSSSPQGNISTFWPISELTAISFWRQSPQHDIQSYKEVLTSGSIFDPYKVHGKLSWTDCGNYGFAKEVSWMSVEKKQLEYASDSLKKLRSLIEQLAEINPIHLSHNEKLAFWINLYNALIMHAYLAYGVPKSDMKLFTLMQKAAYTVGGIHLVLLALNIYY